MSLLSLSFEANQGQADSRVRFFSRGSGYSVSLTDRGAILAFRGPAEGKPSKKDRSPAIDEIRVSMAGARHAAHAAGAEQLPGFANYFIGHDPAGWHRNVPTYARVKYTGIYPGIDVVYYGNRGRLEYDFIVAPGADPNAIELRIEGASQLMLTADGDLAVATAQGRQIAFHRPSIYQEENGQRRQVAGHYILRRDHRFGFSVGRYDRSTALVIDPALLYSTFIGGENLDSAGAVTVDRRGNAYVVGSTISADFPVTRGAFDTKFENANSNLPVTFVSKLNPLGTALLYSTYLGSGACDTQPVFLDLGLFPLPQNGLAVDQEGNTYIAGSVCSGDFPVTKGAFQTTIHPGGSPAYVAKLNAHGNELIYATYLGGSGAVIGGESAAALAVDEAGNAYIAGTTYSSDFPVTKGAFQNHNRAAVNEASNAFVTELNSTGTELVYSTYLGGSGIAGIGGDLANAIALDSRGNAYVAGLTFSADFPVSHGAFQTRNRAITAEKVGNNAFVTKLNASGSALLYSTYLGGSGGIFGVDDAARALAVDTEGSAYVAGSAASADFPVTEGAFQTKNKAAGVDQYPGNNGFITKFAPAGDSLVYSTFLGGSGSGGDGAGGDAVNAIAVDGVGDAYVAGITSSADFPVTAGAFQSVNRAYKQHGTSGFVTELNDTGEHLVHSTYLSGRSEDYATGISLECPGIVYVAGFAGSEDFPVSKGATQDTDGGFEDAFIAKLDLRASARATNTTLTSSANPQVVGKPVTFTASVGASAAALVAGEGADRDAGSIPAGSVEFIVGTVDQEIAVKVPLDDTGKATYTTADLGVGSYTVVASYATVETDFGPSSSPTLTQMIDSPASNRLQSKVPAR